MARTQTESGGFSQNPALDYPVYVLLHNDTAEVSATINTGPGFTVPEFYDDWADGPHAMVFMDGSSLVVRAGTVTVDAVYIPPVIPPGGGALPGGPAIVGRPTARPRMVMRHFFVSDDEEEKEKPPKPTKARVRRMQLQALDEAEGLLGKAIPQKFNPPVREAIKDFWDQQATWDDLQRGYAALVAQIVEKAQRDADEDDIESILLTM